MLSSVLLDRYYYHCFAELKIEELTDNFPIGTKIAKKLDLQSR